MLDSLVSLQSLTLADSVMGGGSMCSHSSLILSLTYNHQQCPEICQNVRVLLEELNSGDLQDIRQNLENVKKTVSNREAEP